MDDATYSRWWPLHVRAVRGESLTAEEQAAYQAGLKELHQEESFKAIPVDLERARAAVAALEAERARLQTQRERLDEEIALLEAMVR